MEHTSMMKETIMIAAPCPVSWDSMTGDDRSRFCTGCSKTVYNLSDMNDSELEMFLQKNGFNNAMARELDKQNRST
jgi:hypothetical protein